MKKYKLIKELPLFPVGTVFEPNEELPTVKVGRIYVNIKGYCQFFEASAIGDWLEEITEGWRPEIGKLY